MKHYSMKARQAGMTLIELTVVLLVLIGLAGLMIPYVAGFISKTHDSTGDSNLNALNGAFARYEAQYGVYPNDLQTLAIGTGAAAATYSKLMNTQAGVFTPVALNATEITSLKLAGINNVEAVNPNADTGIVSATFAIAGGSTAITAATTPVLTVAQGAEAETGTAGSAAAPYYLSIEDHLADAFGTQAKFFNATCNNYVIVGVGQESTLTQQTIADAPVHFAQNGNMGPEKKYNRFVAVFEVDKSDLTSVSVGGSAPNVSHPNGLTTGTVDCSGATNKAKFIGTAMLMGANHLFGLAHSFGHTYANIASNQPPTN